MRRPTTPILLLAAALLTPLTNAAADDRKKDAPRRIEWLTSFQDGQKAARKRKKILVVDFWATWCGPCRMMDQRTFRNPTVIGAAEPFVWTKVDIDRDLSTVRKYGISGVPTVMFFGSEGERYATVSYQEADQFLQTMKYVVAEEEKAAALAKRVEAEPDNAAIAFELGGLYARWHKIDAAARLLEAVERLEKNADPKSAKARATRRRAMPEVYADIGEGYLETEKPDRAETFLRKGLAAATRPYDIGRLRRGIVNTFLARKNTAAAIRELEALIAAKNVPGPLKAGAQGMLQYLQKQQ